MTLTIQSIKPDGTAWIESDRLLTPQEWGQALSKLGISKFRLNYSETAFLALLGVTNRKRWLKARALVTKCRNCRCFVHFPMLKVQVRKCSLHAEKEPIIHIDLNLKRLQEITEEIVRRGQWGAPLPSKSQQNSKDIKLAHTLRLSKVEKWLKDHGFNGCCYPLGDLDEEEAFGTLRGWITRKVYPAGYQLCGDDLIEAERRRLPVCELHYGRYMTLRDRLRKREQRVAVPL